MAPVTAPAASLQRNAITLAICSGATALARSFSLIHSRLAGVSITAGTTALTRTPVPLSSVASTWVKASTPALATVYAADPPAMTSAAREPTLTIDPRPDRVIRDPAARHDHHTVSRMRRSMAERS